jgi:MFS transporter, ACS family, tartrate transporter
LNETRDLGLTPFVYGWGAGIFFIGYVLFEIPSNWALVSFRCAKVDCADHVYLGAFAILMAATRGPVSFLILRFLLGSAEAGFAPGIVYYMMVWFPAKERANVVSIYYLGVPLARIIAGPLSGLVLDHLNGWLGLRGWQWLFIIEGLPAIIAGFIALRLSAFAVRRSPFIVWPVHRYAPTPLRRYTEPPGCHQPGRSRYFTANFGMP